LQEVVDDVGGSLIVDDWICSIDAMEVNGIGSDVLLALLLGWLGLLFELLVLVLLVLAEARMLLGCEMDRRGGDDGEATNSDGVDHEVSNALGEVATSIV
jgi:hypothetical protein